MTTPSVQLAFQGGGAKLIAMLPIAAAFQKAQKHGTIRISAVSGASAGSICAALIAMDTNFDRLVDFLQKDTEEYVSRLFSSEAQELMAFLERNIFKKVTSLHKNIKFLKHVVMDGGSVLESDVYNEFVEKILSFGSKDIKNIENGVPKLFINSSDIVSVESKTFTEGSIVKAVQNSSAIPFAFRSFAALRQTHYVDGGICENLPIDVLVSYSKDPIFAILPQEPERSKSISNILDYALALISASIEHSVKRSRQKVSEAFIKEAVCDFQTFGFKEAIALIKTPKWFEAERDRHIKEIEEFALSYGYLKSKKQYRSVDVDNSDDFARALKYLTERHYEKFTYELGKFEVKINHDKKVYEGDNPKERTADTLTKTAKIKVTDPDFKYFRSHIIIDNITKKIRPTVWSAFNETKKTELEISVLSLDFDDGQRETAKPCVVIFNDAFANITVGDVIEIQDTTYVKGGMADMNKAQSEFLGYKNTFPKPIKRAEIILEYPVRLGPYSITNHPSKSEVSNSGVTEIPFRGIAADPNLTRLGIWTDDLPSNCNFYALFLPENK